MTTWIMIAGMAFITFANRFLFLAKSIRFDAQPRFKILLSYSAYAVLTAIWAPIVFSYDAAGWSYAGLDFLLAATAAAVLTIMRVPGIFVVLASIGLFVVLRFTL